VRAHLWQTLRKRTGPDGGILAPVESEMLYSRCMKVVPISLLSVAWFSFLLPPAAAQSVVSDAPDFSGMYSFQKEGEFMQITLEDKGAVSGFISRYGDSETDKGTFLDQFIKSGTSKGKQVSFTTESVHRVSYTFEGAFDRGPGKKPEEEGYYVLRGTLTKTVSTSDPKNATAQSSQVEFRSFPRDAASPR